MLAKLLAAFLAAELLTETRETAHDITAAPAQEVGACCPDARATCNVNVEYVIWWLRRAHIIPVVTTGPTESQGILGNPGVTSVYGDETLETRHHDRFIGIRFSLEWYAPQRTFGFEGRAFFLERDSTYFTIDHLTDPLLALSYFDAATGQEASEVIAGVDPKDGLKSGGFVGYSRIELFGEEANFILPWFETDRSRIELLGGARFLQMRDRYHHTATSRFGPDQSILTGVVDHYRIHNAFYGGQLGVRGECRAERWFLQLRGTVALGADSQLVRTHGERVFHTPLERTVTDHGLFVQDSNTDRYRRTNFDGVAEADVNVGYQYNRHWRSYIGYTFLYWADPLRAAGQLDRTINQDQPASRPAIPFDGVAFWAHGVNFGLEFSW